MFSQMGLFIASLWRYWWALMSSAVFTGISVVSAITARGNKLTVIATAVAAVLFFFWASFKAWQIEHNEHLKFKQQVVDSLPKLEMHIETCSSIPAPSLPGTLFILGVGISNSGCPSVAGAWRGVYRVGRSEEVLYARNISAPFTLRIGNEAMDITREHQINYKTVKTQIGKYDLRNGRLLLELPRDASNEIAAGNYEIEVSCVDGAGQEIKAIYTPKLGSGGKGLTVFTDELIYYPTMPPESASYIPKLEPPPTS